GSPLGISLIGKDGYYKYINPRFVEMFGYCLEDIPTGREWFRKAFPDEEYRHQVISTWKTDLEKLKQGEFRAQIFNVTCKDGSEKIIYFRPVTMETGDQFLIYEDITEHKQAEAELRESEERYRALVESSTDAILVMDNERRIVSCDRAFLDLFGYEKNKVEGRSIRIIHQSDESFRSFGEIAYPVIDKLSSFRTEWDFVHKDGTIFSVETVTSAIKSPNGSIGGYVAIIRDITERKQAEAELIQTRNFLQNIFDSSTDGITTTDLHGNVMYTSPRLKDILGYNQEEIIGKKIYGAIRLTQVDTISSGLYPSLSAPNVLPFHWGNRYGLLNQAKEQFPTGP
ncbi:MAG: PAS domain S-box protein, partial [Deltaproteobacteria bacterium]|nr:PAS domain S-box protein [Deltaproteobacteria bacterium]